MPPSTSSPWLTTASTSGDLLDQRAVLVRGDGRQLDRSRASSPPSMDLATARARSRRRRRRRWAPRPASASRARSRGAVLRSACSGASQAAPGRRRGSRRRSSRPARTSRRPPRRCPASSRSSAPAAFCAESSRSFVRRLLGVAHDQDARRCATASTGRMTSRMKKNVSRFRKLTCILGPAYACITMRGRARLSSVGRRKVDSCFGTAFRGAIAQLGERLDRTQEVGGSSPPSSIASVSAPLAGSGAFLVLAPEAVRADRGTEREHQLFPEPRRAARIASSADRRGWSSSSSITWP